MRSIILTIVLASLAAWAHGQVAVPASTLSSEKLALNTVQIGGDVVKTSTMRVDTSSRRGSAVSAASKAAERDDSEHPFRMALAALLLMVAIGLRRFR